MCMATIEAKATGSKSRTSMLGGWMIYDIHDVWANDAYDAIKSGINHLQFIAYHIGERRVRQKRNDQQNSSPN